jgi:hypothetical protein
MKARKDEEYLNEIKTTSTSIFQFFNSHALFEE